MTNAVSNLIASQINPHLQKKKKIRR